MAKKQLFIFEKKSEIAKQELRICGLVQSVQHSMQRFEVTLVILNVSVHWNSCNDWELWSSCIRRSIWFKVVSHVK